MIYYADDKSQLMSCNIGRTFMSRFGPDLQFTGIVSSGNVKSLISYAKEVGLSSNGTKWTENGLTYKIV